MGNRYNKIMLEAEEGITFEALKETSGKITYRARNYPYNVLSKLPTVLAGEYAEVLSVYTDNDGKQAVVPPKWTVSGVRKENTIWGDDLSLVIYYIPKKEVCDIEWTNSDKVKSLQKTYDQLVWTPVSLLVANGTLDDVSFNEKFGRRNYKRGYYEPFSERDFHEPFTFELALQKESVDIYGGYYSTRYEISKGFDGPRSIKDADPWTHINKSSAEGVAYTMFKSEATMSHLMYGAEYDTREEWILETKAKTFDEIVCDSSSWGNCWDTKGSPHKIVKTGSREEWCANNIYDFSGNSKEWTQERYNKFQDVVRGGGYHVTNYMTCSAHERCFIDGMFGSECVGFRSAVYINSYLKL